MRLVLSWSPKSADKKIVRSPHPLNTESLDKKFCAMIMKKMFSPATYCGFGWYYPNSTLHCMRNHYLLCTPTLTEPRIFYVPHTCTQQSLICLVPVQNRGIGRRCIFSQILPLWRIVNKATTRQQKST